MRKELQHISRSSAKVFCLADPERLCRPEASGSNIKTQSTDFLNSTFCVRKRAVAWIKALAYANGPGSIRRCVPVRWDTYE